MHLDNTSQRPILSLSSQFIAQSPVVTRIPFCRARLAKWGEPEVGGHWRTCGRFRENSDAGARGETCEWEKPTVSCGSVGESHITSPRRAAGGQDIGHRGISTWDVINRSCPNERTRLSGWVQETGESTWAQRPWIVVSGPGPRVAQQLRPAVLGAWCRGTKHPCNLLGFAYLGDWHFSLKVIGGYSRTLLWKHTGTRPCLLL